MFLPTLLTLITAASAHTPPQPLLQAPCDIPELLFAEPPHSHHKQVAFTFDDGPDGALGQTNALLDALAAEHIHSTFFVCADNWVNVAHDEAAQKTLQRIQAEGHEVGNHTSHHPHLPSLTPREVAHEFSSTEDMLLSDAVLGPNQGPITLLRAPYGQPFEADPVNKAWVGPIVAQFGVHVGWNINSYDWACKNKECVVDNVMRAIDAGQEGSILMHSNYEATTLAMPILAKILRERGYAFVGIEQLVQDKYGATSAQLREQYLKTCGNPPSPQG